MSTEELLKIEPPVLTFQFELNKQASCSIRLSNKTQKHVAFKVMTTNPTKYWVQLNIGIISPRTTLDITVTMQSRKEAPPSMQCKDKFQIQSAVASSGATIEDVRRLKEMEEEETILHGFNFTLKLKNSLTKPVLVFSRVYLQALFQKALEKFNEEGHPIQKCKLDVVYNIVPQIPSSVPVGSTRVRKLLDVKPSELQFLFELNKELSCSFQLSNVTENRIAFKVKTTNTKKYCVIPIKGFVLPRSTCDITVKMRTQNRFPPDMKCSDKFLIQSTVANSAATTKDITADMFNKAEECKLRVEYVFQPHQPSTKSVTSEEGSIRNVSAVEARNSNNPEVVPGHDRNVNNGGDVILGFIIIGLFGIVIWYIMKMAMPLIGDQDEEKDEDETADEDTDGDGP